MHFGIVFPELLAGARVDGVGHAPRSRRVHHPVDDQRGGLQAALGGGLELPCQAQLVDVGVVDFGERAESLFVIIAAIRQPIALPGVGRRQRRIIHRPGRRLLRRSVGHERESEKREAGGKYAMHGCGFYGNF
jgi:hypothetical protein